MFDSSTYRNDPQYLNANQYRDSGNLSSRIQIHQKFSTGQQPWNDFIFELAALKPGARVLELGCGSAALWRSVVNRVSESTQITLTDFSLGMIKDAADSLGRDTRFQFVCMDSMNITFMPATFDLVIANHMLYHLPSVSQALRQISALLLPEGKFMAATNGPEHMLDLDILLAKFSRKLEIGHRMSSGFNLLNGERQLREFFTDIELHLYTSDLWVTNAQLLTNYAYSTPLVKEMMGDEGRKEMTAFFQRRIDHYGGISIRKQTGVYLSKNPMSKPSLGGGSAKRG
ncbi:MAG: class I SAM-dependent methyltransferase [Anaerolineaceae bacterium]|jgi:ubiquinone/menaquinone biosynthesis C-methylase UbiE|nr:class I SAM-dependent methyltransferase [Anaerolineaceae bacterium]MDD4043572.1 class I SAM-dependent methyltransferase [Anaerolineaceae bacterium]MDD4578214.1 class I SAM-dependent methyltransferase [Anaerolineaceae bacterium]